MKVASVFLIISLSHNTLASVLRVEEPSSSNFVTATVSGWEARDMPDPRYAPERCGISKSGWLCDPDGVFQNVSIGGGPAAADNLNTELWSAANQSHCPCPNRQCYVHNAIILVAVVERLKNPKGLPQIQLLTAFAKELQEQHWKADDTECQQEVVIVISLQDHAIVTEVGDDLLKSGMLTYDDVELVGGISHTLFANHQLFEQIKFMISAYKRYIDHPISHRTQQPRSSVNGNTQGALEEEDIDVTKIPVFEVTRSSGLPSSIVVVIVLSALVFLAVVILIFTIPLCKKGDTLCFGEN